MKRIWLLILVILGIAGSAYVRLNYYSIIEDTAIEGTRKFSGIEKTSEYQQYLSFKEAGMINEEGLYKSDLLDGVSIDDLNSVFVTTNGSVTVSFKESNIVGMSCYLDKEMTQLLRKNTNLESGTKVYILVSDVKEGYENSHVFSHLELKDNNGSVTNVQSDENETLIELTIPTGINSLVVLPKTELKKVNVEFDDYFIDEKGNKITLSGIWSANSENYGRSKPLTNTKAGKYIFSYNFDSNEYYVDNSFNPNVHNVTDGKAELIQQNILSDQIVTIQLSKYVTFKFNNDYKEGIDSITVNDVKIDLKDGIINKLKCGDKIRITTKDGYLVTPKKISSESEEPLSDGKTIYTYIVPEQSYVLNYELGISKKSETRYFTPKTISNGTIEVRYANSNNNEELGNEAVSNNEKVKLTIKADPGYYMTGKKVENNTFEKTMKYGDYDSEIDDIIKEHPIKKYISLTLDASDKYGKVEYKVDGKTNKGLVYQLKEGQTIELTYTLTDDDYQIVNPNLLNKKKKTVKIKVNDKLDGNTIERSQYIEVKKKGE